MVIEQVTDYLKKYSKPVKIMEICGTHTASIVKNGIHDLLSENIRLVSGPGCPVCVTQADYIDGLAELSLLPRTCVLSFGDLFRVMGNKWSFTEARTVGGSFCVIYSPIEAASIAKASPDINFIVAAIGFETTAPLYAILLEKLIEENINNVKLAVVLKTMPAAISYICESESVDCFLCPGHVSSVIGEQAYEPLCDLYRKPFVIAGFEPERILLALYNLIWQFDKGQAYVENYYPSAVTYSGNKVSQEMLAKCFEPTDGYWRGVGIIKGSALKLRTEYERFEIKVCTERKAAENTECRCGDVMLGRIFPNECKLFGSVCTPENPVGACMVSNEGACGIWHSGGNR